MAIASAADNATPQASLDLLSLPPIAIDTILGSASFSGAIAACSCRALRDEWRTLTASNPELAAAALVDRFKTVDAAAEHLYRPDSCLSGDRLVKSNIEAPVPGLLDAFARPLLFIASAMRRKRPPVPSLNYMAASCASDAHALRLLRHLSALRESAGREADPAVISQPNGNHGAVEDANQDGTVAGQGHAVTPFPRSVIAGAAFAGHDETVMELLKQGADPVYEMLPGAVRAGNARLCAALLEGGRMASVASLWSAAAGGDVLGIRGNPSDFVNSYAASEKATRHMESVYSQLLPLTYIDPPLGLGGGKGGVGGSGGGGGGGSSTSRISKSDGGASDICARGISALGLLQGVVTGWCSREVDHDAGPVQSAEDVAAALAAARAAAQKAADTALGDSTPLLPQYVQSSTAAAAAAATAAALAALTPPEDPCGGGSSGRGSDGGGGGDGGGGSCAHTSGQACAFLSSTTNHAAVRQLLLQWRPSEGLAPPPHIRAAALQHAAAVGAWPMVSELMRAGIDPRDSRGVPATLLYLALVQGRGAMAAWLLARLLARGVICRTYGALIVALVTRIMGIASPLQLLVHSKFFEAVPMCVGMMVVYSLFNTYLPMVFLPTRLYALWSLWLPWSMCYERIRELW